MHWIQELQNKGLFYHEENLVLVLHMKFTTFSDGH